MSEKYCRGCSYLYVAPNPVMPICLSNAKFIHGPLRKRIGLTGRRNCFEVNIHNDCKQYRKVSWKGFIMRKWMNRRLRNGKVKTVGIKAYTIDSEAKEVRRIVEEESEQLKQQAKSNARGKTQVKAKSGRKKGKTKGKISTG